jgi:hypothetical protein
MGVSHGLAGATLVLPERGAAVSGLGASMKSLSYRCRTRRCCLTLGEPSRGLRGLSARGRTVPLANALSPRDSNPWLYLRTGTAGPEHSRTGRHPS